VDRDDWLGWRGRAIALAALGGASLSRRAFAPTDASGPSSLQMQVLVWLALTETQSPEDDDGSVAEALTLDWEVLDELLESLVTAALVARVPVQLEPNEAAELAIDGEEPPTEPVLSELGAEHVRVWLESSQRLFRRWPPEQQDVDDAVDPEQ
jgi:hypothetical protein